MLQRLCLSFDLGVLQNPFTTQHRWTWSLHVSMELKQLCLERTLVRFSKPAATFSHKLEHIKMHFCSFFSTLYHKKRERNILSWTKWLVKTDGFCWKAPYLCLSHKLCKADTVWWQQTWGSGMTSHLETAPSRFWDLISIWPFKRLLLFKDTNAKLPIIRWIWVVASHLCKTHTHTQNKKKSLSLMFLVCLHLGIYIWELFNMVTRLEKGLN